MKDNKLTSYANPWRRLSRTTVFDNPWIRLEEHKVVNPAGNPSDYGVLHFKNRAVGIIPIDEQGYTYLVGQTRYPLDSYSWEIPMGGVPLGEDALLGAQRELQEETGVTATQWEELMQLHTSNSVTDETAVVYVARQLTLGLAQPEDTEDIRVLHLPFHKAVELVIKGEVTDGISVAAILKLAALTKSFGN